MDAPTDKKPIRYSRLLPYWAVFQADVQQTLRSWIYRVWVMVTVLATAGYLLYRLGPYREAGIIAPASEYVSHLLRWTMLVSVTLIVVLTAGTISSERGSMADSVLSRGISRYQYFLGKWHARLATVLATYFVMGVAALTAGLFLLHEDLSLAGCAVGLLMIAALLTTVITCGVTVSAMVNNTLMGVAILWVLLYGGGAALALLPGRLPSPQRALDCLNYVLRGHYSLETLGELVIWALGASLATAIVGLISFSRRDV
jgi:ABC-type transport system involved in multi-copper enzyme maturation permease subunit